MVLPNLAAATFPLRDEFQAWQWGAKASDGELLCELRVARSLGIAITAQHYAGVVPALHREAPKYSITHWRTGQREVHLSHSPPVPMLGLNATPGDAVRERCSVGSGAPWIQN